MKVTLKLYATLSEHLPPEAQRTNALELEIAAGTTVAGLIDHRKLPRKSCHLVLIDGLFVPPQERASRVLAEGETLAIWPPIAGG